MPTPSQRPLWPIIIAVAFGLALLFLAQTTHPTDPPEDAYITFRYAQNLANGHGLVWNPGEDPVEGSTEFIWAVMVAGMQRLGFGVEAGALALNLIFGALATIVVAGAAYLFSGRRLTIALFAVGAFAAGPVAYHVRGGFATTLFTLLLTLSFISSVFLVLDRQNERLRTFAFPLFALSGLFLGLTRPEGVLYAGLALVALLFVLDAADRRRLLGWTVLLFVLPGAIYFLWRWRYFGHLLPNTFYVKSSGGLLHLLYLDQIYALFVYLSPLLVLIGLWLAGARKKAGFRWLVVLVPALIFPWAYLLIDQLQNLGARFQYPVYPIYLLAASAALGALTPPLNFDWRREDWRALLALLGGFGLSFIGIYLTLDRPLLMVGLAVGLGLTKLAERRAWFGDKTAPQVIALFLLLLFTVIGTRESFRLAQTFYPTRYNDLQAAGVALQPFADRGYTLVASEAGWLPYFSQWRTIDPFGLNDEHVTHEGLSADYLDAAKPDVILYHVAPNPDPPRWADLVEFLHEYAESNGYTLAAVIERISPEDLHIYYVRPDNPDAPALIEALTGLEGFTYSYKAP